jgi:hypothetical protein
MPQGVIVQDLRVLSLPARAEKGCPSHSQSKYCLLRRSLFRLHVRIAAGRPSRGEQPTARWGRARQRRAGCL